MTPRKTSAKNKRYEMIVTFLHECMCDQGQLENDLIAARHSRYSRRQSRVAEYPLPPLL